MVVNFFYSMFITFIMREMFLLFVSFFFFTLIIPNPSGLINGSHYFSDSTENSTNFDIHRFTAKMVFSRFPKAEYNVKSQLFMNLY